MDETLSNLQRLEIEIGNIAMELGNSPTGEIFNPNNELVLEFKSTIDRFRNAGGAVDELEMYSRKRMIQIEYDGKGDLAPELLKAGSQASELLETPSWRHDRIPAICVDLATAVLSYAIAIDVLCPSGNLASLSRQLVDGLNSLAEARLEGDKETISFQINIP